MAMTFAPRDLNASALGHSSDRAGVVSPLLLIVVGSLACFSLSWQHLVAVWQTGTFFDTDDAMRMVQVRAWLAGQSWFDMTAHRMDPPSGVFMHWSRVVDVPLGAMIRFFALFTTMDTAELLARIAFPLALQTAMVAATIYTGQVLAGPRARLAAMILTVTSCFEFGQFPAGRIDHHAPQIVLLMLMTGTAIEAVAHDKPRRAVLAALCMAASIAISLENLPFIAVLVAAIAIVWAVRGGACANALKAFGLALAGWVTLFFVATVSPSRYLVVSADALSAPHVLAAVLGGPALALLAILTGRHVRPLYRMLCLMGAGAVVMGIVIATCPGVLTGPFAHLDPVVRDVWLSRVTEALPLSIVMRLHPQSITLMVCPMLAGVIAIGFAVAYERGMRRVGWMMAGAVALIGCAGAFWEVRVVSSAEPLTLLGGVWAVTFAMTHRDGQSSRRMFAQTIPLILVFSPLAWLCVPVPEDRATVAQSMRNAEDCRAASNVVPLASLTPGLVFATIDSGSHILVHTSLSVLGAPYHRNNHGNRTVIDGFSAAPTEAEAIVKASGARYVALCPGQVQAEALTERNPDSLAGRLIAGDVPNWLEPLPIEGTSYKVFAVK